MSAELALLTQVANKVDAGFSAIKSAAPFKAVASFIAGDKGCVIGKDCVPFCPNNIINGANTAAVMPGFSNIVSYKHYTVFAHGTASAMYLYVYNNINGMYVKNGANDYQLSFGSVASLNLAIDDMGNLFIAKFNGTTSIYTFGGVIGENGIYTINTSYTKTITASSATNEIVCIANISNTFVLVYKAGTGYFAVARGSTTGVTIGTTTLTTWYVENNTLYFSNLYSITAPTTTTVSVVSGGGNSTVGMMVAIMPDGSFYHTPDNSTLYYRQSGVSTVVGTTLNSYLSTNERFVPKTTSDTFFIKYQMNAILFSHSMKKVIGAVNMTGLLGYNQYCAMMVIYGWGPNSGGPNVYNGTCKMSFFKWWHDVVYAISDAETGQNVMTVMGEKSYSILSSSATVNTANNAGAHFKAPPVFFSANQPADLSGTGCIMYNRSTTITCYSATIED